MVIHSRYTHWWYRPQRLWDLFHRKCRCKCNREKGIAPSFSDCGPCWCGR